jgi:DNA-binding transcriptional regulator YhcF (GntR family)
MNHNADKYWIEDSELLTEAEKTQLATALRELERQGIIEYRDGHWTLVKEIKKEKS